MDEYIDPLDDPIFGKSSNQTTRLEDERKEECASRLREEVDLWLAVQHESLECYQEQRLE